MGVGNCHRARKHDHHTAGVQARPFQVAGLTLTFPSQASASHLGMEEAGLLACFQDQMVLHTVITHTFVHPKSIPASRRNTKLQQLSSPLPWEDSLAGHRAAQLDSVFPRLPWASVRHVTKFKLMGSERKWCVYFLTGAFYMHIQASPGFFPSPRLGDEEQLPWAHREKPHVADGGVTCQLWVYLLT